MINNRNKNLFWQGYGTTATNLSGQSFLAFPSVQNGSGTFVTPIAGSTQFTLAVGTYHIIYNSNWVNKTNTGFNDGTLSVELRDVNIGSIGQESGRIGAMTSIMAATSISTDGGSGIINQFLVVTTPITIGIGVVNGLNITINQPSSITNRVINMSIQKIA